MRRWRALVHSNSRRDEFALELGVSPGLLKYHFGDRENLMLETMRRALDGTVRRIHHRIDGVEDPEAAMTALLDAVFVGPRANRDFHLIYLDRVQYALRQPTFAGLEALARSHITQSYSAVIRMGVDTGVFQVSDVDDAAQQARAVVEGVPPVAPRPELEGVSRVATQDVSPGGSEARRRHS